jgi:hypothetical protein
MICCGSLFSKLAHVVIASCLVVCSYFLIGDGVPGLLYVKRVFAMRSKHQLF